MGLDALRSCMQRLCQVYGKKTKTKVMDEQYAAALRTAPGPPATDAAPPDPVVSQPGPAPASPPPIADPPDPTLAPPPRTLGPREPSPQDASPAPERVCVRKLTPMVDAGPILMRMRSNLGTLSSDALEEDEEGEGEEGAPDVPCPPDPAPPLPSAPPATEEPTPGASARAAEAAVALTAAAVLEAAEAAAVGAAGAEAHRSPPAPLRDVSALLQDGPAPAPQQHTCGSLYGQCAAGHRHGSGAGGGGGGGGGEGQPHAVSGAAAAAARAAREAVDAGEKAAEAPAVQEPPVTLTQILAARDGAGMGNGASQVLQGHLPGHLQVQQLQHSLREAQAEAHELRAEAEALRAQAMELRVALEQRDQLVLRLQREVHKLKSVLQQATSFGGDLLASLHERHGMAGQAPPAPSAAASKKQGVSGESSEAGQTADDIRIERFDKDFRSKQLIKEAIMDNDFLKNLDSSQVREIVDSMYPREFPEGSYVIREGDAGSHLYVSAEGEFEVVKEDKVLGRMGPGKAFGELAILYNCTRTASIRVVRDARVWVLDRRVFQQIMMRTGLQRIEDNVNFLRSVPLLRELSDDLLAKIADALEVEFFPSGAHIVRQGASGDTFFIISSGTVRVTQRAPGSAVDEPIRTLSRGDYFGEQALLREERRTASVVALPPGVQCLTLDRAAFSRLIGDLSELRERDYGDAARGVARPASATTQQQQQDADHEYDYIRLDDLDVVGTLGVGGFGRVELVQYVYDRSTTFALKCMKKQHIVDTQQQEHVYSEKSIMMSCRSPFICRLYRTFRDSKYVYMLLEACLGGEVWTILRDRGCFDDNTTRFITACVVEAFEYLHAEGIIYRDLKPENLLLDSQGYVKLVDFGFSKRLGLSSKTWTFCGTPEYVAPEIILNKGHDRAVDYWALGVLMHELLTGTPPFTASDPMKTYNIILKGIDMVDFPRHITRTAVSLIKRLCRDAPSERLGYQRGGISDIKKHKWFQGFDWEGLKQRTLAAPIVQQIRGPTDTSNFDNYPRDNDIPPDEFSNWDIDF